MPPVPTGTDCGGPLLMVPVNPPQPLLSCANVNCTTSSPPKLTSENVSLSEDTPPQIPIFGDVPERVIVPVNVEPPLLVTVKKPESPEQIPLDPVLHRVGALRQAPVSELTEH